MALHIIKESGFRAEIPQQSRKHVKVESVRRTGLKKLFGPKPGTVSGPADPVHPLLQVIAPEWKGGQRGEQELLRQCYAAVLQKAVSCHFDSVDLPLLTAEDPEFPAHMDHHIAVETARAFAEEHSLDVFLTVSRPAALRKPKLHTDVEKFLAGNLWEAPTFPVESYSYEASAPVQCSRQEPLPPMSPAPMCSGRFDTGALPSRSELEDLIRATDAGFSETLLNLIDKTGKKDSEIYNKANVSRQHFSKIRNNPNYKPTKPTAVAFAIALELDLEQTRDLIGRAGYALTNSSKFDVIVMYFIRKRNYNMCDINETLYEFDQTLLGVG